jgi:hypothetical protein
MNHQWEKRDKLGMQTNVIELLLTAIKAAVQTEKSELERKLNNLKRLGVISISKEELNKRLEEIKFK